MITWHDILYYVRLFLRWWFVIVFSVLLAAGTAWLMTRKQPDVYFSQATLRVGNNFEVAAPSEQQVSLSNVLADYYVALVKREVILGPVVEQLKLNFPWPVIRDRMLLTRVDRGANLLEIKITDTNPDRAAAIANAIADQLIAYTPNAPEKVAAQQAEISRQIAETQANTQAVEAKIAELEDRLANLSSAIDISDVQSQLDALQRTRQRYLDEYGKLIILSNQTSVNSLSVFEQARSALEPLPKKRSLTLAMAGMGGLLMAIVAILVLDRLDERWRTGSELLSRTGIRSLGDVPQGFRPRPGGPLSGGARQQALNHAFSNMILAAQSKLPRTLLVSSPRTSPARSAVAIDIAEMYARTGHRVLLVDTESEPTHIAGLLGSPQPLAAGVGAAGAGFDGPGSLLAYVHSTPITNLLVLSGREHGYDRFSSLVPLVFWPDMLSHLRKSADVVIFDGPSVLSGPEASLLAPLVDGVLLVLNGKLDARSNAIKSRKQLTSESDAKFLGAIVTLGDEQIKQASNGSATRGGSFHIAFGRSGITITLSEPKVAASSGAPAHRSKQQRLLNPSYDGVDISSAPAVSTSDGNSNVLGEAEHVTWEDLLSLEVGGPKPVGVKASPAQNSSFARNQNVAPIAGDAIGPVRDASAVQAIITPPFETPAVVENAGVPKNRAPRPDRQRRTRIDNSRRNCRTSRTSTGPED